MPQPSHVTPFKTEAGELALHRIGNRYIEEVRVHSARHPHIRMPRLLDDLGIRAGKRILDGIGQQCPDSGPVTAERRDENLRSREHATAIGLDIIVGEP